MLTIIGAGMSGLLCGALNPDSIVYEAGPERESDHKALFRCKTDQIAKILGLSFKEVTVHKAIWLDGIEVSITPRIAHMYSQKISNKILGRSILNIATGTRFIPPSDFIDQLKLRCNIVYNHKIAEIKEQSPVISTIPMPSMLNILNMKEINDTFTANPIYVNQISIKNCDTYCTIYYPNPEMNTYRASITGNTLITEGIGVLSAKELNEICNSFGISFTRQMMNTVLNHIQKLGKITPIDNKIRQKVITDMTIYHNVYSLGRFATWRPKVMLDDVLEDIWHIKKLIQGGNYAVLKHTQED